MSSQQSAPRFPPNGFSKPHSLFGGPARSGTPKIHTPVLGSKGDGHGGEADAVEEEDPKRALFKELFRRSEARLDLLFNGKRSVEERMRTGQTEDQGKEAPSQPEDIKRPAPSIKAARTIDEEDYGDDDEEEDEDVTGADSPLKHKSMTAQAQTPAPTPSKLCPRSASERTSATSAVSGKQKTSEEERKEVEEEEDAKKRAAEESSFKMFYTFESDRDAMIQQQRLDEVNRDAENAAGEQTQGTDDVDNVAKVAGPRIMGGADYGSNQLAFKNILARMTSRPHLMKTGVTDAQLNKLFSEVRKNRSKWASEDKIGQEELYEACDKVLTELKAKTEYSSPFLTKVNKREAPDYQNIIKKPMDLGTITKNLRQLAYKSKKEFVDDLNLIWANCLKYNADPQHFLRKKALYMRKETERLVPLIPDIVIKDRAEVEAEEQRNHVGSAGMGDDSDDGKLHHSASLARVGKLMRRCRGADYGFAWSQSSYQDRQEGRWIFAQSPPQQIPEAPQRERRRFLEILSMRLHLRLGELSSVQNCRWTQASAVFRLLRQEILRHTAIWLRVVGLLEVRPISTKLILFLTPHKR